MNDFINPEYYFAFARKFKVFYLLLYNDIRFFKEIVKFLNSQEIIPIAHSI